MTKFFKGRNKTTKEGPISKPPEPRDIKTITDEYNQTKTQAGEVQYQIYALNNTLEQMNRRMLELNHEGAARQKLDREATPKKETEAPTNA